MLYKIQAINKIGYMIACYSFLEFLHNLMANTGQAKVAPNVKHEGREPAGQLLDFRL